MAKNIFKDSHVVAFIVFVILVITAIVYLNNFSSKDYLVEKYSVLAQTRLQRMDILASSDEAIESVIDAFRKAIAYNPVSGKAGLIHFNIARIYVMRKNYDKAMEELKKVSLNFARNSKLGSEAQFQVGRIYEVQGKWDEAVSAYKKVHEDYALTQRGLYVPLYIAEQYKKMGKEEEAQEAYANALKKYEKLIGELGNITQTAILVNYVALTYASQGMWDPAVEKWEEILLKYPESPLVARTLLILGEMYANQLGNKEKAIEKYNRVLNEYAETDLAHQAELRLLQLHFFTGDYKKAREWCLRILNEKKDDEEVQSETLLLLARTHEKEGTWAEAEKVYNSVVERYPTSSAALRVPIITAKHYQEIGQNKRANEIYATAKIKYERLIKEEPESPKVLDAQDLISLIYVNQEDWGGLVQHLDILLNELKEKPRHAQLLFLKGYITQTKMDNADEARKIYETFLSTYPEKHPLTGTVNQQITLLNEAVSDDESPSVEGQEDEMIESLLPVDSQQ
ncbi:tetratricopeptide repeat protein [Candidatus Omnitrophota bacterium]